MTLSTERQIWTDEEFMALAKDGHRYELVNGEAVDMGNSGMEHGYVACILVAVLMTFVQQTKLGAVCGSSTAFTLKNGNKRSPDISFVAGERLKELKRPPRGFLRSEDHLDREDVVSGFTIPVADLFEEWDF